MTAASIVLTGEPKSTQTIYRAACRGSFPSVYMTREGKLIKEGYQLEARIQWRKPVIEGDVQLDVTLYFSTRRKADADNFHKLSLDALIGIVYRDDNQITDLLIHKRSDKGRARIEIRVL